MTDQNSQFFAILTAVGEAKQANANTLGVPWSFAQMGVGDANNIDPVPSRTQTKLINERRRAPLNQLSVDPANAGIIIAEQVIPPDVGGWWIREIGLYDADGDLVAIANCAPSYKPLLTQGTGKTQVVRLNLVVTSTSNVQLKIDPAVVLATRDYVDSSIISVLPKNKVAGTYSKVRINDRGIVQEGSNPTTLAGYGITDAMAKGAGGLLTQAAAVSGRISAIPETRFFSTLPSTEDRPAGINYAAGVHITWGGGEQCVDFLGALNGQEEFFVRTCYQGAGTFRKLWTEKNFDPSVKADKATTLGGYGITDALPNLNPLPDGSLDLHGTYVASVSAAGQASLFQNAYWNGTAFIKHKPTEPAVGISGIGGKAVVTKLTDYDPSAGVPVNFEILDRSMLATATELDEGATNEKWVSVGGLTRFFGRVVKQATNSIAGVLRTATQAEVDAGTNGDIAVTPSALRWKFAVNMGRIGYIVFPSYLGGLILQWQTTPVNGAVDQLVSFPLPFPRSALMVFVTCDYTRNSGVLNYHAASLVDNSQFVLRSSPNASAGGLAFSVGF